MQKLLVFGLMSISCSVFAGVDVTSGSVLEHETCTISLPAESKLEGLLKAKGLSLATYQLRYQVNGSGPIQTAELTTDSSNLVDRKSNGIDAGDSELQAKLKAIRYSGVPSLRLYHANGAPIPGRNRTTENEMDNLLSNDFDVQDTESIRAALVNVFEKANLLKTSPYWYELEYIPLHEIMAFETAPFTLRSLAKDILEKDNNDETSSNKDDKVALKIIAGVRVSVQEKNSITPDTLREMRNTLVQYSVQRQLSEEEYSAKIKSAIPNCHIVKK